MYIFVLQFSAMTTKALKDLFNVGDYVYYFQHGINYSDTIPGIIIKKGVKRVKIALNMYEGDDERWVSYNNIEKQ